MTGITAISYLWTYLNLGPMNLFLTPNNLELYCKVKYYIDHYLDYFIRHRPTFFIYIFLSLVVLYFWEFLYCQLRFDKLDIKFVFYLVYLKLS